MEKVGEAPHSITAITTAQSSNIEQEILLMIGMEVASGNDFVVYVQDYTLKES